PGRPAVRGLRVVQQPWLRPTAPAVPCGREHAVAMEEVGSQPLDVVIEGSLWPARIRRQIRQIPKLSRVRLHDSWRRPREAAITGSVARPSWIQDTRTLRGLLGFTATEVSCEKPGSNPVPLFVQGPPVNGLTSEISRVCTVTGPSQGRLRRHGRPGDQEGQY